MAKYPITENVGVLGASFEALKTKIVNNLTTKGATDVSVGMRLIDLIDKVLEVSYQPLPHSVKRKRSGITTSIDASLHELSEALYEAHVRFKLKLEVAGVDGLTDNMTLNEYADKILEIQSTPQYELYPDNMAIKANGDFGEFYFNTKSAVKVDFLVTDGFTLDRTTGQGVGNFIIRVYGSNNTTTSVKTATITVMLDNGKYPSETISVTQAAGVMSRGLEQPYLLKYPGINPISSIRARGGEIFNEYPDSVVFMHAKYTIRWNGIITEQKDVRLNSFPNLPDPFIVLTNDKGAVYPDHLTAKNNITTSARSATIVGHNNETGLDVSMVVTQDAGAVAYTYSDMLNDGLAFYSNGINKSQPGRNYTGFGAHLRTIWNGIETKKTYYNYTSPQHTIEIGVNGGGFYLNAVKNIVYASDRTTVIGNSRTCSIRCIFTEAGIGTVYSDYITVTQDANAYTTISWGGYYCNGPDKWQSGTQYFTSGANTPTGRLIETNSPSCYPTVTIYLDKVVNGNGLLIYQYHKSPNKNIGVIIDALLDGQIIASGSSDNSYINTYTSASTSGVCSLSGPSVGGGYQIIYNGNINL